MHGIPVSIWAEARALFCWCLAVLELPADLNTTSFYSEIVASISDIKSTPDGRYIFSRDYMTLKLWDVNMEARPLKTINVHEHLRPQVCSVCLHISSTKRQSCSCAWHPCCQKQEVQERRVWPFVVHYEINAAYQILHSVGSCLYWQNRQILWSTGLFHVFDGRTWGHVQSEINNGESPAPQVSTNLRMRMHMKPCAPQAMFL